MTRQWYSTFKWELNARKTATWALLSFCELPFVLFNSYSYFILAFMIESPPVVLDTLLSLCWCFFFCMKVRRPTLMWEKCNRASILCLGDSPTFWCRRSSERGREERGEGVKVKGKGLTKGWGIIECLLFTQSENEAFSVSCPLYGGCNKHHCHKHTSNSNNTKRTNKITNNHAATTTKRCIVLSDAVRNLCLTSHHFLPNQLLLLALEKTDGSGSFGGMSYERPLLSELMEIASYCGWIWKNKKTRPIRHRERGRRIFRAPIFCCF